MTVLNPFPVLLNKLCDPSLPYLINLIRHFIIFRVCFFFGLLALWANVVIVVASKRPRLSQSDRRGLSHGKKRNRGTSRRHVTSPPGRIYIPPSAPTRPVCVSGVVTTRLLQCSAYIPFIPLAPGNPGAPPLPAPAPVRDRDRCTWSADGRQVHGQMASAASSMPDWPR